MREDQGRGWVLGLQCTVGVDSGRHERTDSMGQLFQSPRCTVSCVGDRWVSRFGRQGCKLDVGLCDKGVTP